MKQGVLIGQRDAALVKVMESLQQLASSISRLNSGFEAQPSAPVILSAVTAPLAVPAPTVHSTATLSPYLALS